MKSTTKVKIFETIVLLIGLGLIVWSDWRIAIGVFLFTWGNNMEQSSNN